MVQPRLRARRSNPRRSPTPENDGLRYMTTDGPSAYTVEGRIAMLGNFVFRMKQGRGSPKGVRRALLTLTIIPIGIVVLWAAHLFNDLFN